MDEGGGGKATMMTTTMNLQIHTTCEQLTVMLQREVRYRPATTTKAAHASAADLELQGQGPEIPVNNHFLAKVRMDLCNWAFRVVNEYEVPRDAVHVAMNLVDRYNAVASVKHASSNHGASEPTTERAAGYHLHLLMVGSLYLAAKLTGINPPLPSILFASMSHGQISALQVEAMEAKLLLVLDWLVHPPTCHEFLHGYALLLILVHEQEQQQQFLHFDPRGRRQRGSTVADGTMMACSIDSPPGGSYITPVSGPIQFHYGIFSNGGYGHSKRFPTYHDVMKSVWDMACQILDTTVSNYGFVQFKPSTVACAALYYAMQYHEDEGYFYHIYRHHSFPSPLEQLHGHGVMVHAVESSKCLESIYLLFEAPPPPISAQAQQSEKTRSKKKVTTTKRTTSPQNIMDQLDAVNDP